MPEYPYLAWPLFRRSEVAAFGRSLTANPHGARLTSPCA